MISRNSAFKDSLPTPFAANLYCAFSATITRQNDDLYQSGNREGEIKAIRTQLQKMPGWCQYRLGMVRFLSQQGVEERFPGWLVASSVWLNRNEHRIDLR